MNAAQASSIASVVCSRHGVSVPRIVESYSGSFFRDGKIFLDVNADVFTLLHELAHVVYSEKGERFKSYVEEELAANRFALSEMKLLGFKPYSREYRVTFETENPEGLLSIIVGFEEGLGIKVKSYNISGKNLTIVFDSYNPVFCGNVRADAKNLAPIIWAIIALAGIFGLAILSWQVSGVTQNIYQILEYVVPLTILGISAWAVVSLLK